MFDTHSAESPRSPSPGDIVVGGRKHHFAPHSQEANSDPPAHPKRHKPKKTAAIKPQDDETASPKPKKATRPTMEALATAERYREAAMHSPVLGARCIIAALYLMKSERRDAPNRVRTSRAFNSMTTPDAELMRELFPSVDHALLARKVAAMAEIARANTDSEARHDALRNASSKCGLTEEAITRLEAYAIAFVRENPSSQRFNAIPKKGQIDWWQNFDNDE